MFRSVIAAIFLSSGVAATAPAQTPGGPPIAYVKRVSNGDEIYLVNDDKTGLIRLYKAPSKITITQLDLRPGGGEIAFLEGYTKLKMMAFDDHGRPEAGNPRTIRTVSSPCTVESPDYHPTDGRLLFVEGCGRNRAVRTVQPGSGSADDSPLIADVAVYRARWSRLADAVYYVGLRSGAGSSDPTYLYRYPIGGSGAAELGLLNEWTTFDIGRVGEKIYWGSEPNFFMLDRAEGGTTAQAVSLSCPRGSRMARSGDDTQMIFHSPWARGKGNYIMIGVTSCATDPTSLTAAGSWGWTDWRP